MSTPLVTRFLWSDDSGAGTDGTIINNAQLQAIFDAIDGAIGQVLKVKSGAYTVLVTDDIIKVTAGTFTLDLYTAVGNDARALEVVNLGSGVVTLDGFSTQTINGAATWPLPPGGALRIRSDGANWVVVSEWIQGVGSLRQTFTKLTLRTHPDQSLAATQVILQHADEIVMHDGTRVSDWDNLVADITVSGVGGLDSGVEAPNTFYEPYAVCRSSDGAKGLILHQAPNDVANTEFTTARDAARGLRLATGAPTDILAQGMQFTTTDPVYYFDLELIRVGSPGGFVSFSLQGDSAGDADGTPVATTPAILASSVSTVAQIIRLESTEPFTPALATQYHGCLEGTYARSDTDYIAWRGVAAGGYAGGAARQRTTAPVWSNATGVGDFYFRAVSQANVTALTLSAGYDQYCRLSPGVRNDNGSNLVPFTQTDRRVTPLVNMPVGSFSGSTPLLTDCSALLPPGRLTAWVSIGHSAGGYVLVAGLPDGFGPFTFSRTFGSMFTYPPASAAFATSLPFWISTRLQALYCGTSGATGYVELTGWDF